MNIFNFLSKMNKKGVNKHLYIIIAQVFFIFAVVAVISMVYPRANVNIHGDVVKISSLSTNVIVISEFKDFSNPIYYDLSNVKNLSIKLKPGKYYWKPANSYIEGFSHEFVIDSIVGMNIENKDNETDLVNIGNVKINVTRNKDGVMTGHIILDEDQAKQIEDSGQYVGRQI